MRPRNEGKEKEEKTEEEREKREMLMIAEKSIYTAKKIQYISPRVKIVTKKNQVNVRRLPAVDYYYYFFFLRTQINNSYKSFYVF